MSVRSLVWVGVSMAIEVAVATIAAVAAALATVMYLFPVVGRLSTGSTGWNVIHSAPWWGTILQLLALAFAVAIVVLAAVTGQIATRAVLEEVAGCE
ncbi:hypothetical protein ACFQO4_20740 [Saliphagus sp. GCM10025334]